MDTPRDITEIEIPLIHFITFDKNGEKVIWGNNNYLLLTSSKFLYKPEVESKIFIDISQLKDIFDLNDDDYLGSVNKEKFEETFFCEKYKYDNYRRNFASFIIEDIHYLIFDETPVIYYILKSFKV